MKVWELKDILDECNDDDEVRFVGQPSWPFEYQIADAVRVLEQDIIDGVEDDEDSDMDPDEYENATGIVYLSEGYQIGYVPRVVLKAVGWR